MHIIAESIGVDEDTMVARLYQRVVRLYLVLEGTGQGTLAPYTASISSHTSEGKHTKMSKWYDSVD